MLLWKWLPLPTLGWTVTGGEPDIIDTHVTMGSSRQDVRAGQSVLQDRKVGERVEKTPTTHLPCHLRLQECLVFLLGISQLPLCFTF